MYYLIPVMMPMSKKPWLEKRETQSSVGCFRMG